MMQGSRGVLVAAAAGLLLAGAAPGVEPDPQGKIASLPPVGDHWVCSQLLFFLSPRCPVCKTLLPTVQRLARSRGARLVVASDGDDDDHQGLARSRGLPLEDYFVSTELGLRYRVAKLPTAVLLDAAGVVRAHGIVNTREHVESLFEAQALGVGSIQEYLAAPAVVEAERGAEA